MDALLSKPLAVVMVVAVLAAALVGFQAVGALTGPAGPTTNTGRVLGSAGFAYLGGFREFAAAVLWNRLEPQFDQYYSAKALKDLTFLMPSLYMVIRLNPQFVQAYYNASFILGERGQWNDAYRLAKEGIENNPKSGLMRANYAQLLMMQDRQANISEAVRQATLGLSPGITYDNPDDEFESLGVFHSVFSAAGRSDVLAMIERRQAELRAIGATGSGLPHD